MKPLLVTSGEPAGIGPDLCLALAGHRTPLVVMCDKRVLAARALQLGLNIHLHDYQAGVAPIVSPNQLTVISPTYIEPPIAGQLNPRNALYVIGMLTDAANRCLSDEFSALVTAPVHKAVINEGGVAFTGHTEFLAKLCQVDTVVMMLACESMRVALVTTHLPLRKVTDAITSALIIDVITQVHRSCREYLGLRAPTICVAGLNPHAGESGYLGREELDVIIPALSELQARGIDVQGPLPADTMFTPRHAKTCDVFVAMYHDQGLPVLKYAGFGHAVNVTLGLPIIRTSVDHGTALDLAGTGCAESGSMLAAVDMAAHMVMNREKRHETH